MLFERELCFNSKGKKFSSPFETELVSQGFGEVGGHSHGGRAELET